MQALRAVVILMGLLLVVGLAVLFYGIINDWHKKGGRTAEAVDLEGRSEITADGRKTQRNAPLQAFGDWRIALPAGAVIDEMESNNGLLFLRYRANDQTGVLVLELTTKRNLGIIHFK